MLARKGCACSMENPLLSELANGANSINYYETNFCSYSYVNKAIKLFLLYSLSLYLPSASLYNTIICSYLLIRNLTI